MPIDTDIVDVSITDQTAGVQQAAFNVAMLLSTNAGQGSRSAWTERAREYTGAAGVAADFATGDYEIAYANKYFGQTPSPSTLVIGRRLAANWPTQEWYAIPHTVADATLYRLLTGSTETDVLSGTGATSASIVAAFVSALNVAGPTPTVTPYPASPVGATTYSYKIVALGVGPFGYEVSAAGTTTAGAASLDGTLTYNTISWTNVVGNTGYAVYRTAGGSSPPKLLGTVAANTVTYKDGGAAGTAATPAVAYLAIDETDSDGSVTGTVGTHYVAILAEAAGTYLPVSTLNPALLSVRQVQTDASVQTDLDAIALEDPSWYGVINPFNSLYAVTDSTHGIGAWIEANEKIFVAMTNDTRCELDSAASATDVMATAKAQGLTRTALLYSREPADAGDAGWVGVCFPKTPGSLTWTYKTIAGLTADKFSATQIANIKAKNGSLYYTTGGLNIVKGSKVASGKFIDGIMFLDWLKARMSEAVFGDLARHDKIGFVDSDIAILVADIRGVLAEGAANGGLVPGAFTVTAPLASAISTADKTTRHITITFTAKGAGAIEGVTVNGTVTT